MAEILFLTNRNIYYRHYGPFINYLLNEESSVHLLHDFNHPRKGLKKDYFPHLHSVPQFNKNIQFIGYYNDKNDIVNYINQNDIQVIFSLHSYISYGINKHEINKSKWVTLQHWADNFQHGTEEVLKCDLFLSYSKFWWDSFLNSEYHLKENSNINLPKVYHIGHPLNYLNNDLDKNLIKKKYCFLPEKKVLTYLPIGPPRGYAFENIFQKIWLAGHYSSLIPSLKWKIIKAIDRLLIFRTREKKVKEKDIIIAIKRFCLTNNFTFVIKLRAKSTCTQIMIECADKILYDENLYPPTITELMHVSDITISHQSMTTFEAMAMKGYCINIDLKPVLGIMDKVHRTLFNKEWESVLNIKNMSKEYSGSEFINEFASSSSNDFDFNEKHYDDFMLKYFSGTKPENFEKAIDKIINLETK